MLLNFRNACIKVQITYIVFTKCFQAGNGKWFSHIFVPPEYKTPDSANT